MAFDMNATSQQISSGIDQIGSEMSDLMNKAASGEDLSEQDLLVLQDKMNRWNIMISMQTNIQKTWSDALKNIVNNMR